MKQELIDSGVVLIEDTHTYLMGSTDLQGITSTLIPAIFGDYTENIPQETLKKAAERGKKIHTDIQLMEEGFHYDGYEINAYKRLRDELGLRYIKHEYIVTDGKYFASPIDIVYEDNIIADIKCTSELHLPEVTFQLSWYATYYNEQNKPNKHKVSKAYVFHLPKEGSRHECKVQEVTLVPATKIKKIVKDFLSGNDVTQYAELFGARKNTPVEASTLPAVINTITRKMLAYEHKMNFLKKEYDEYKEQYKAALIEYFVQSGEKSINYDGDSISYIAPTTRVSLDTKAIKADHPDIYEQYKKESVVSETIRINIK